MVAFVFPSTSPSQFNIASMVIQTRPENGSEPIPWVNICITINTMLNFDSDANANETRKWVWAHSLSQHLYYY